MLRPCWCFPAHPYAYLNYLIFDEQFNSIDAGAMRVPQTAGFDPGFELLPHQEVKFQPVAINTTGYMYVWVSNESEATKVWFDDLSITHHQSMVAQATDYGPWGEVLREQKTNVLDLYRYGYQGQFAEKDEETGWNHFELREYDAVIGRTLTIDPSRQFNSPYSWVGNDPISGTDPTGGICPTCPEGSDYDVYRQSNIDYDYSGLVSGDGVFQLLSEATVSAGLSPSAANAARLGIFNAQHETITFPATLAKFYYQFAGGVKDFGEQFITMTFLTNFANSDKYFHSKANFNATLRGDGGEYAAEKLSNLREIFDQRIKGDSRNDSLEDQEANRYGRERARHYRFHNGSIDYKEALPKFRRNRLLDEEGY